MNIPEVVREFKGFLGRIPDVYSTLLIVILVAITSFGLGRISALESTKEQVLISPPQSAPLIEDGEVSISASQTGIVGSEEGAQAAIGASSGIVVGSRNGTKYHLPWCSGAKRIVAANKITFSSRAEAEKAGYTAAANCPGL